jgi:hypothetical protein
VPSGAGVDSGMRFIAFKKVRVTYFFVLAVQRT